MTREESTRPFLMMRANWSFLDFDDSITADLWFDRLEAYPVEEVVEGVKRAISEIDHTPVVAEVLSYVDSVRSRNRQIKADEERMRQESDRVSCWDCHDYGFITVIYPTGYEAVKPCNCQKADQVFGKNAMQKASTGEQMPEWKKDMLFGPNEIPSQYELVRVSRQPVPTGETFKGQDGEIHKRMKWGYVPYFPKGDKEEVIMQYQKKRRKS